MIGPGMIVERHPNVVKSEEVATVLRAKGSWETFKKIAEMLAWICAALKISKHEYPTYSDVALTADSSSTYPRLGTSHSILRPGSTQAHTGSSSTRGASVGLGGTWTISPNKNPLPIGPYTLNSSHI